MKGTARILDEELRAWLESIGLASFEDVFEGEPNGTAIERHRHRDVWRIDGPGERKLYLKRYHRRHLKDRWPDWRRGRPARSDAAIEIERLEWFVASGLDTVTVASWGESEPGLGSFLITVGEPGWIGLDAWLETHVEASNRSLRAVARALGAEIARMHGAGLRHPDLSSWHVLVPEDEPAPSRFRHLDLLRASRGPASRRRRARDLTCLVASLPMLELDRRLRWVFLREYEKVFGGRSERPALLRAVRLRLERVRDRKKFARSLRGEWVPGAREGIWWRRGTSSETIPLTLHKPEGVPGVTIQRRWADRMNGIWSPAPDGGTWYVKVHRGRELEGVRRAERECDRLLALEWEGLPAARLIGRGSEGRLGLVVTQQVPGSPLDDRLREGWPGDAAALMREVDRLARFIRRFHELGYYHKDLYLCHVFATDPVEGPVRYHLIDATRIQRGERVRRRWFVKDLAALASSWPDGSPLGGRRGRPPRRVAAKFLEVYCRGKVPRDFLSAIRKKVRRILEHVPKSQR
ncbi:MAG: lipopolysaccharide kinase InaA family protein [Planctomycetota bacterium]